MIETINESWEWNGINGTDILYENDFGNLIVLDKNGKIWRICPEELSCQIISENEDDFERLFDTEEFQIDWHMRETVDMANDQLGDLLGGEKYCLKLPGVLGGLYEPENFGKMEFGKLITLSGAIALEMQGMTPEQLNKIVPE